MGETQIFLMKNSFTGGIVDTTLFQKSSYMHFILVQIYIDGTIFNATNENFYKDFSKLILERICDEQDQRTQIFHWDSNQAM